MNLEQFKLESKEQLLEYGKDIPLDRTYDSNNNQLTFKNSDDANRILLEKFIEFTLWYDLDSKNYIAGCQELCYNDCISYYNRNKHNFAESKIMMKAIKNHHKSLA